MTTGRHVTNIIRQVNALLCLALPLIGCSRNEAASDKQGLLSTDAAPGTLTVDVLESGRPEHYWQYEIRPSAGTVTVSTEERFADPGHENIPSEFREPTGAIQNCGMKPEASSSNQELFAWCDSVLSENGGDRLLIVDAATKRQIYEWTPKQRRKINGFAWAPDSGSLAILNTSSYYGKNPSESLSALSGHPVPHDTIFLNIIGVKTGGITEYRIRENVISSFSRILKWTN